MFVFEVLLDFVCLGEVRSRTQNIINRVYRDRSECDPVFDAHCCDPAGWLLGIVEQGKNNLAFERRFDLPRAQQKRGGLAGFSAVESLDCRVIDEWWSVPFRVAFDQPFCGAKADRRRHE